MVDLTDQEKAALRIASDRAGEYVQSLPTADLSNWTHEQWDAFLEVVVGGFFEVLHELKQECPF